MSYVNNKGADQLVSYLVVNPEDRFSRDEAHIIEVGLDLIQRINFSSTHGTYEPPHEKPDLSVV